MNLTQGVMLFLAAVAGGMVNSIAGGGTLLTFPALVWAGHSSLIANATNTLALAPGAFASSWGYRHEVMTVPRRYFVLLAPGLIGGIIGAYLLSQTPARTFARIVPWLVLFATILFMVQPKLQQRLRSAQNKSASASDEATPQWLAGAALYQFVVGIYGGYFGAGIGILVLAMLGMLGLSNLHQMNGLKNILAGAINLIAAIYFITADMIRWPEAIIMAVGAFVGGYGMARLAQRLGQTIVRRSVIIIGLTLSAIFFWRG
jgi:uncharacterized protein